jgi:hypothetical protein
VVADPRWRLSGGAANNNPALSLGGVISSTEILAGDNNLFDDVSGQETIDGHIDYRGVYIFNAGNVALTNPVVWIQDETIASADIEIAAAVEAIGVPMATIATETTQPAGVTFQEAPNKIGGIALPSIPAGSFKGIWVRRIVAPVTGAAAARQFTLRIEGDTT